MPLFAELVEDIKHPWVQCAIAYTALAATVIALKVDHNSDKVNPSEARPSAQVSCADGEFQLNGVAVVGLSNYCDGNKVTAAALEKFRLK